MSFRLEIGNVHFYNYCNDENLTPLSKNSPIIYSSSNHFRQNRQFISHYVIRNVIIFPHKYSGAVGGSQSYSTTHVATFRSDAKQIKIVCSRD